MKRILRAVLELGFEISINQNEEGIIFIAIKLILEYLLLKKMITIIDME